MDLIIGILIGTLVTLFITLITFHITDKYYNLSFSDYNNYIKAFDSGYIEKTIKSRIMYRKIKKDPLFNLWKYMHDKNKI